MAPDLKQMWDLEVQKAQIAREANAPLLAKARKEEAFAVDLKQRLIDDLRRVAQIPRPILGPSSSRERYRELGHYSHALVPFLFGQHQEFQRAAGLRDSRGTTKVQNRAAVLHSAQKVAAYAEKELKPWVGAFDKSAGRKHLEVVVGSDFHSHMVDPFALRVFVEYIAWSQPDVVVFNGDVVDFPSVSRHRKLPGHFHWTLWEEIKFAKQNIFAAVRQAAPNATLLFTIGNHEYRLVNYVADECAALADLPSLEFATLFGLEEFQIGLICRSNFLAPYSKQQKRELSENWHAIGDAYVVTHGTALGKVASADQLARFQMSGTSGHTHRPQLFCGNSLGTGPLSWMSTPMMASFAVGRDYVSEPSQWGMGFGRAVIHDKQVSQSLITVHNDWAEAAGRLWTITEAEKAQRAKLFQV